MKSLIPIAIIITIFLSCSSDHETKTVHLFLDLTDSLFQEVIDEKTIKNDIVDAIHLDKQFTDAALIHIHDMDNLSRSRPLTMQLPHDTKGNSMIRKKQIEDFLMDVESALSEKLENILGKDYSKLFEKLCGVYESQEDKPTHTLIYSDFLQNSESISFYSETTLSEATAQPLEFARQKLDPICQIDSLAHTTFHLHTLRNVRTDRAVNKAEAFWKNWLQSKGARVIIKS